MEEAQKGTQNARENEGARFSCLCPPGGAIGYTPGPPKAVTLRDFQLSTFSGAVTNKWTPPSVCK